MIESVLYVPGYCTYYLYLNLLLVSSPGALELQEIADNLPGLIYKPGVSSWILASKELEIYKTFDEVPEALHNQTRPCMFPPKPEEADKFHLDRW